MQFLLIYLYKFSDEIVFGARPAFRIGRVCILLICILAALYRLNTSLQFILLNKSYLASDFAQDLLMAHALIDGQNPYEEIPLLSTRYFGTFVPGINPHISPHPLTLSFLLMPIAALPPAFIYILWVLGGIVCLAISIKILLARFFPEAGYFIFIITTCTISLSPHFYEEIQYGQANFLLLLISTLIVVAGYHRQWIKVGILLGFSLVVRIWGIPLLALILANQKSIRQVSSGVLCVVLIYFVLNFLFLGVPQTFNYVNHLQSVTAFWRMSIHNFAIGSVLPKFAGQSGLHWCQSLEGGRFMAFEYPSSQAFADNEHYFQIFQIGLLLTVCTILYFRGKSGLYSLPILYGQAVAAGIATSPLVWSQNFNLLIIPIATLLPGARALVTQKGSVRVEFLAHLAWILLLVIILSSDLSAFSESELYNLALKGVGSSSCFIPYPYLQMFSSLWPSISVLTFALWRFKSGSK